MGLKPGYKPTELAVIPAEWSATSIGAVASFSGGAQPPRSTFKFVPSIGFVRLIQIRDYKTDEFATFIPESMARKQCTADDIMIGRYGPPIFQILRGLDGAYNVALIKVTPSTKIDRQYLYYVLKQDSLFQLIDSLSRRTSGQSGVEMPALKAFGLPLPPRPEQRAIAGVLSDVDALIGALDELIAKKRDLKQAAVQQLLTGMKRLPGFHGEWETQSIGDQIDLLTGFPFPSKQYSEVGVRLLRGSNVKRGETDWAEELVQYWPSITAEIERYRLRPGDLVIAMDGSLVGRSYARLKATDLPALLLQRVARIRSKTIDIGFLTQVVGSDRFVKYCDSVKTVTAIPHISSSDIRSFEIPLPPTIDEQAAIAEVLSDMDVELTALEQRRDKTRALKQGMMQELLTGRTRLV
jgi:type I restriction enzyme S subunit